MLTRQNIINEKANIIAIPIKLPTSPSVKEYSLRKNFFDPTKSSPPNEFMLKLYMRVSKYNETTNNNYLDTNVDNLDKE